jgi:hypothetical protein
VRNKKAVAAIMTAAAIGIAGGIGVSPAYADAVAVNGETLLLSNAPTSNLDDACRTRYNMVISAGDYHWYQEDGSDDPDYVVTRTGGWDGEWIHLDSGSYTWTVCLDPQNGYYIHASSLTPSSGAVALRTATYTVSVTGTYSFGDVLAPKSSLVSQP